MAARLQLYPGLKLHHWTLIQKVRDDVNASSPNLKKRWRVECACGKRLTVPTFYLVRKLPKTSCGCKNRSSRTIFKQEYGIWTMMRRRCNDPSHVAYKHYGGRGIFVCAAWNDPATGFEAFLSHVGPRPSPGHSIDRFPDNNGPYEPGNVRWATSSQQRANQRPRPS